MGYKNANYHKEYFQKNKDKIYEYQNEYSKNIFRKKNIMISIDIDRDLSEKLELKLAKDGITKAELLRNYILKCLNKK